ncbi:hypothetical protein JHK87_006600 [Glycine soja]|nr:hypothetical protein JHK87_006600 [Glycine soja]
MKENDVEVALRALESTLLEVISQTTKEEQEYQAKQKIYENTVPKVVPTQDLVLDLAHAQAPLERVLKLSESDSDTYTVSKSEIMSESDIDSDDTVSEGWFHRERRVVSVPRE